MKRCTMEFGLYLREYLEDETLTQKPSGCILNGCMQLYRATGEEFYRKKIYSVAEKYKNIHNMPQDALAEWVNAARAFYGIYDETGDEEWRSRIEAVISRVKALPREADGVFAGMEPAEQCAILPFYMEYETRFHNKAEYSDIVLQLRRTKPQENGRYFLTGWYLMTLIDVMESMSVEIFEHYKSLEGIFKETIRHIQQNIRAEKMDLMERAMVGYAITKACNMGVLNCEKYTGSGLMLIDGVIDGPFEPQDAVTMGIIMMAYAQYVIIGQNEARHTNKF